MISRRDVVKWGVVAPALVTGSHAGFARGAAGLDAMLVDTRLTATMLASAAGTPILRFAGDVTRVWFEIIEPAWRRRGYVLGGITGSDALFVLETLARKHGRRVVGRTELGSKDERGVTPVSWIIAPAHPSVMG